MAIVWVVEDRKSNGYVEQLIGDFAVRAFSSLASLRSMALICDAAHHPDCLVFDADEHQEKTGTLIAFCDLHFPQSAVIIASGRCGGTGDHSAVSHKRLRFLTPPACRISLPAEIKGLVERGARERATRVYKDLSVNSQRMTISVDGSAEQQALSVTELRLMTLLLDNAGRCLSRDDIRVAVWDGMALSLRTIDTHISRLRKKLSASGVELNSVYGGGYVLE